MHSTFAPENKFVTPNSKKFKSIDKFPSPEARLINITESKIRFMFSKSVLFHDSKYFPLDSWLRCPHPNRKQLKLKILCKVSLFQVKLMLTFDSFINTWYSIVIETAPFSVATPTHINRKVIQGLNNGSTDLFGFRISSDTWILKRYRIKDFFDLFEKKSDGWVLYCIAPSLSLGLFLRAACLFIFLLILTR